MRIYLCNFEQMLFAGAMANLHRQVRDVKSYAKWNGIGSISIENC